MENNFSTSERLCLEMIEVFQKYANTTPEYPEALKHTAQLYERAQLYEKAVEYYKTARTIAYQVNGFGEQFDVINFMLEEAKTKMAWANPKKNDQNGQ